MKRESPKVLKIRKFIDGLIKNGFHKFITFNSNSPDPSSLKLAAYSYYFTFQCFPC